MLTDIEEKIIKKMKMLESDCIANSFNDTVIATLLYGRKMNCLDEILLILNQSNTLDDALNEIYKDVKPLEIVDDEEYDDEDI